MAHAEHDHPGHGHGHHHGHHHGHGHAVAARVSDFSLLRASALQRLILACIPIAALWGLVWWAVR